MYGLKTCCLHDENFTGGIEGIEDYEIYNTKRLKFNVPPYILRIISRLAGLFCASAS